MTTQTDTAQPCCPQFNPAPWDDKTFEWENKNFIKDRVFSLFYMPVNFGSVMRKLNKKITAAGANIPDGLCLADHISRWNMDVYLAVDKEVPGCEKASLSGKFYSKVYEGPYGDTGKWCKDYENLATAKGYRIRKWFMWYTTCPKCAKKYGKNYVAIMSQVE